MYIDFYYALITGWIFLGVFWMISILFIFIRKPNKNKLTLKIIFLSMAIFIIGFYIIQLFK